MRYNDGMNIQEARNKIKFLFESEGNKAVFTALLIMLVGLASFGLGRMSTIEGTKTPVTIEYPDRTEVATGSEREVSKTHTAAVARAAMENKGGGVVASKSGTKYHFPWCAGASQISEKNKVNFASIEDARKAGYTPASNCKGLR